MAHILNNSECIEFYMKIHIYSYLVPYILASCGMPKLGRMHIYFYMLTVGQISTYIDENKFINSKEQSASQAGDNEIPCHLLLKPKFPCRAEFCLLLIIIIIIIIYI
jgi:hypothetical protein